MDGTSDEEQQEREDERHRARRGLFVDRFVTAQRRERRWIALPDLALYCAGTGAMTAAGAYRHLADLLRRGELSDVRGRSRVLFLDPEPHEIPGQHRLSAAMIDGAAWAEPPIKQRSGGPAPLDEYSDDDFARGSFVVTGFFRRCYLHRDDACRVLERLGLAWPPHFDPASPRPGGTQRGRGRRPDKAAAVEAAMRRDLAAGVDVAGMLEKEMAARYGASRDTCRKARAALSRK